MKKKLKTTRKKKNLKQLMLLGVCAITLATSIPAEPAFAQYSYEFTVPEYTEKDMLGIYIDTQDSNKILFKHKDGWLPFSSTYINLDQNPVVINGRTFVPMRAVFEALGCKVDWDQTSRTATVSKDNTIVKLTIGNSLMQVSRNGTNGQVALDAAPVVINGRTLLPLRAPAEAFGYAVTWNPNGVAITYSLSSGGNAMSGTNGVVYIRDSEKQAAADASAKAEAERQAEQAAQKAAEEAAQAERNKKRAAGMAQLEQMDKQYKSGPALDEATYAQEVVKCINIYRSYLGLPAYTVDSAVAAAAQVRAQECEIQFSHVRPNGTTCDTALPSPYDRRGMGENLGRKIPGTDSPATFVISWLNSAAGHGLQITATDNTIVGIGIHKTSEQVYCAGFFIV